jgi:hypothetical protein
VRTKDRSVLKLIQKANLNALWSREPSTLAGNLSQGRKMEVAGDEMGFDTKGPPTGPFPLEDSLGMKLACTLLRSSLHPGKWEKFIQFGTAQKIRSVYSNMRFMPCARLIRSQ